MTQQNIVVIACPACKQKLMLQSYMTSGTQFVCANAKCDTSLRLVSVSPPRVEAVPRSARRNAESSPESYG